jgi:putative zinc finger protein
MSHLEAGLLHALLDGEIPSSELPPIQAHLAACDDCRARLELERQLLTEAFGLVETLEVSARGPAERSYSPVPSRGRWIRPLAWAATVVAAVGLGYAARGSDSSRAELQSAPQPIATRADSPATLPAPPAAPVASAQNAPGTVASREPVAARREPKRSSRAKAPEEPPAKQNALAVDAAAPPTDSIRNPAAPAPAPVVAGSLRSRLAAPGLRDEGLKLERAQLSGVAETVANKAVLAPAEPISFPDAVRRLGGSLRQIDGLIPLRLEAQGPSVRVVYAVAQGELILSQQLIDGRVSYRLIAPAGFPADSLARLRARVRD